MRAMYYYGDFYKLGCFRCRSTLEIIEREVEDPNELLNCRADVVVVMMNPGSSEPKNANHGQERTPTQIAERAKLTSTCPDKAQESIVALMRRKNFRHARVLNLSDIREANKFAKKYAKLCEEELLPAGHSIFCEERQDELDARLKGRPVVVAGWSYDSKLGQLGKAAYDAIVSRGLKVHGWKPRLGFRYPHTVGTQGRMEWLNGIVETWPG